MCSKYCFLMSLWSCCWIVSLVMLIVGLIIVGLVNTLINNALTTSLPVNSNQWSTKTWNNYLNSSVEVDFYVWNCTNYYQVLTQGAVPLMQEVGPVRLNQWTYKQNPVFSADGVFLNYTSVTTFEVLDAPSQAILNSYIVHLNVAYPATMAFLGQTLANQAALAKYPNATIPGYIDGTWYPINNPTLDESYFTSYFNGVLLSGVYPQICKYNAAFYTTLRVVSVGVYFETIVSALAAGGLSQTAIITQWSNVTGKVPYYQYFAPFTPLAPYLQGFELSSPLSSVAVGAALWSSSNPYSLISGISFWVTVATASTKNAQLTAAGKILAGIGNGMTQSDLLNVGAWLLAQTSLGNTLYETIVMKGYSATLNNLYPFIYNSTSPAAFTLTNWTDIGFLQFGTSIFPTFLTDLGAGTTRATAVQKPVSLTTYSLTQASFAAAGLTAPFEFAAVNGLYNPLYSSLPASTPRLTLSQSALLFKLIAGVTPSTANLQQGNSNVALGVFQVLFQTLNSLCTTFTTTLCVNTVYGSWYIGYGGALSVLATKPAAASVLPLLQTILPLFALPQIGQMIYFYVVQYLGTLVTGNFANLDVGTGIAPQNLGLFRKSTVAEVMFGFNYAGNWVPGVSNDWNQLLPSVYNPTQYYTTYASHVLNYNNEISSQDGAAVGMNYSVYTGQDSLNNMGRIRSYSGFSGFRYHCDVADPARVYSCATPAGLAINNFQVWGQLENISYTLDGVSMQPFLEGDANIVPEISFYVAPMQRLAPLQYSQTLQIKGITVRRYYVDQNYFGNYVPGPVSNNTWRNDFKYYTFNEHDGILPSWSIKGGVPLVVSYPHFLLVNQSVLGVQYLNPNTGTGGNFAPDPVLHSTFLDIEPLTGKTMNAHRRLQASFKLSLGQYGFNGVHSKLFARANTLYVPVYWADQWGELSDSDASTFTSAIYGTRSTAATVQTVLVSLGVIGLLAFIALCCIQHRMHKRENNVTAYTMTSN